MSPFPPPPEEPQDLAEYLWFCRHWEHVIFFRAQREGKWTNVALADLTPQEFGEKLARLLEENRLPIRAFRTYMPPEEEEPC